MTYEEILHNINAKIYHPVYVFAGDEAFFIDQLSNAIENTVLDDSEKAFNQSIIYGNDTTIEAVIGEVRQYPMMANHRVVIVREAQNLKNYEETLMAYLDHVCASNILVLCLKGKKIDKRTSFGKKIEKVGVYLESKKLWDNQVAPWITTHCKTLGHPIDSKASYLLAEYMGSDLEKIDSEIQRLKINLPPKSPITPELIEQYIGINKDYNPFELNNALAEKNRVKANRIVNYFERNPKAGPNIMLIPIIYSLFIKIMLYQVYRSKLDTKALMSLLSVTRMTDIERGAQNYPMAKVYTIIHLCRQYDAMSKGVDSNASNSELMRELIFKILH